MRRRSRPRATKALSPSEQISVLTEEYRALYRLAEFRMASLDRRVPAAGAAFTAFLGGVVVLPPVAKWIVLVALPLASVWLVRTTINHARSFEDTLRRIEQLEVAINARAGGSLLCFQSSHPSRGRAVGGRTGRESVGAVLMASAVLLGACLVLAWSEQSSGHPHWIAGYAAYVVVIAQALTRSTMGWAQYRYESV